MSLFLPKLSCKKEVDEVIKRVAEKVLVLRFGRDEDSVCMQLDEIVSRANHLASWLVSRPDTLQRFGLLFTLYSSVLKIQFVFLSRQLSKTSHDLSNMTSIYLVDVDKVPVYTRYFDISFIPSTVFFFNGQHMKVDYG